LDSDSDEKAFKEHEHGPNSCLIYFFIETNPRLRDSIKLISDDHPPSSDLLPTFYLQILRRMLTVQCPRGTSDHRSKPRREVIY